MKYSLRILNVLMLFWISILSEINAQDKLELTQDELESYKSEVRFFCRTFFESTLNLVDNNLDMEMKIISANVIKSLFSNMQVTIMDYYNNPEPEGKNPSEYTWDLIMMDYNAPLFEKKFKISDSIRMSRQSFDAVLLDKYSKPVGPLYKIYFGTAYVLEELLTSQYNTNQINPIINLYEKGVIKKVDFSLRHDINHQYELKIEGINIIREDDQEYKGIRNYINQTNDRWSDKAEQEYVISIAKELGVEIENIPVVELPPSTPPVLAKLSFMDHLVPGNAHIKFMDETKANRYSIVYKSVLGGSLLAAGYFKYKEIDFRNKHNEGLSIDGVFYNKRADRQERNFYFSIGAAAGVMFFNIIDIHHLKKRQQGLLKKGIKTNTFGSFNGLGIGGNGLTMAIGLN